MCIGNQSFELTYSGEMFTISTQRSYRCAKNQKIVLEPVSPNGNSTLSIKDFQVQAFATDKGASFGYGNILSYYYTYMAIIVMECVLIIFCYYFS